MCGSVKTRARHHIIKQSQKVCLCPFPNEDMQYFCPSPLGLAIFFWYDLFPAAKKYFVAWLPLTETVPFRFEGLPADGNITFIVGSVSHPHSFGVVSNSLRMLAVLSADGLKRPCGIASWCAAIGAPATHLRRDGEPPTAEVDISVTPNLSLRVHDNTQCVSGHPVTVAGFVFSLSQHVQRQEQKLIFTSLTWHAEIVGPFACPTSPAGGCLEENAGDVVQSMAGRVLQRLLCLCVTSLSCFF